MILLILTALLLALMIAVGGERGASSFGLLICNLLLCGLGAALLSFGVNPYGILAVGCVLFLVLTVPVQNGMNRKTAAVLISSAILLLPVALVIAAVCGGAHLAGLDEYQASLMENSYLASGVTLNVGALMLLSLTFSELGAIVDTGMTVATSLHEIRANNPSFGRKELRRTGMQVGGDIIGTTINTLVFIAFGETAMLCLLYVADGYSLTVMLNSKSFFQQFGGILFSCESCLLVIPLTVECYCRLADSAKADAFFAGIAERKRLTEEKNKTR